MAITTHVLDTSRGHPARGLSVLLERVEPPGAGLLGRGVTSGDGRIADFGCGALLAGTYRLTFDTGSYFMATGVDGFYPSVNITFQVLDPSQHYHVPLLLNPFGYSTYRGS